MQKILYFGIFPTPQSQHTASKVAIINSQWCESSQCGPWTSSIIIWTFAGITESQAPTQTNRIRICIFAKSSDDLKCWCRIVLANRTFCNDGNIPSLQRPTWQPLVPYDCWATDLWLVQLRHSIFFLIKKKSFLLEYSWFTMLCYTIGLFFVVVVVVVLGGCFGHTAHGILVPQPGIEPVPPALEARSLTHWTTREVPKDIFF